MAGVSQLLYPLTQQTFAPDATTAGSLCVMPPTLHGLALEWTFYIEFSAGSAAGVVQVETASNRDYTGTWASEATVTWSAASKAHVVHITALMQAVRLRISTTVTGGTVVAYAMAANRGI